MTPDIMEQAREMAAAHLNGTEPEKKNPLYNEDAEQCVLSACLMELDAIGKARRLLAPRMFYADEHREIFGAILDLADEKITVDPVTLAARLDGKPAYEKRGARDYVAFLIDATPTAANVAYHAGIVKDRWNRRELIRLAEAVPAQLAAGARVEDVGVRLREQLDTLNTSSVERFKLLSVSELAELPEPYWLIESIIPGAGLIVLFGAAKSYKSFLALDWAIHIALGLEWQGHRTTRGGVCYIYAEGASGLQPRVTASLLFNGLKPDLLDDSIRFVPRRVLVDEPLEVSELNAAILAQFEYPPALIIIDTLARNIKGDESKSPDMNAFVRGCDALREATGAAVMVVHHTGHTETERARGSSNLPAALDTGILCTRDEDRVTVSCKFQKDAAEFGDLAMQAITIALPGKGSSLALKAAGVNSGELTGKRLIALKSLHNLGEGGATHTQWFDACESISNGPFGIVRKWLLAQCYVVKRLGKKYELTDAGRLALPPSSNSTPAFLQPSRPTLLQHSGGYITPDVEERRGVKGGSV